VFGFAHDSASRTLSNVSNFACSSRWRSFFERDLEKRHAQGCARLAARPRRVPQRHRGCGSRILPHGGTTARCRASPHPVGTPTNRGKARRYKAKPPSSESDRYRGNSRSVSLAARTKTYPVKASGMRKWHFAARRDNRKMPGFLTHRGAPTNRGKARRYKGEERALPAGNRGRIPCIVISEAEVVEGHGVLWVLCFRSPAQTRPPSLPV
jgi:hypothetical protein